MIDEIVLSASELGKQVSSPEGSLTILENINLQISSGEVVALVGPSGAGKTTLLALLAGLDNPSCGSVQLCGAQLEALDEDGRAQVRGRHVGFVFQSFHLVPSLTALENVMLPLELAEEDDAAQRARAALDSVGLASRTGHYPRQLSGGEKQRPLTLFNDLFKLCGPHGNFVVIMTLCFTNLPQSASFKSRQINHRPFTLCQTPSPKLLNKCRDFCVFGRRWVDGFDLFGFFN